MNFIDCQGFAGAFTLATVQAGFTLVGKVELPGGFGARSVTDNARLLGGVPWVEVGPHETWPVPDEDVHYLMGNPPCSGFSLLNTAALQENRGNRGRGADSPINDCMWALADYAGRLQPEAVAFESVQGAFSQGRELMQQLRDHVEDRTGVRHSLNHVLVSGGTLRAAQMRHRYFMVLIRGGEPLKVEVPATRRPITYEQAIGDLAGMENTWDRQRYPARAQLTAFQLEHRRLDGQVDSHAWLTDEERNGRIPKNIQQVYGLLRLGDWRPGEELVRPLRREFDRTGSLPAGFNLERIQAKEWQIGFQQPRRIDPTRPGYVVTGNGGADFIHWEEDRYLSVREVARLQGFPDGWTFRGAAHPPQAYAWIGKGIPVQSGRWLSSCVRLTLEGDRRANARGVRLDGRDEYKVDVTHVYRGKEAILEAT